MWSNIKKKKAEIFQIMENNGNTASGNIIKKYDVTKF